MPLIRIFVSSPGDCDAERKVLDEVVDRINSSDGDCTGIYLRLFKWEKNVIPKIGAPPQLVVDEQTPLCDIYLGLMSSRFGGDGTRESGTEVEFRRAVQQFGDQGQPWMLFYFNDAPPPAKSSAEAKQLARVFEFREELEKLGIVGNYSGVRGSQHGFFETVELHLRQLLLRPDLKAVVSGASALETTAPPGPKRAEPPRDGTSATVTQRSALDVVLAKKLLRCGATNHPPLSGYNFTDDRRVDFSGYYVELARDVAARNSLAVEFVPIQWHEFTSDLFATPAADPRAIDLVLSVFETSARRDYAAFCCNFHRVDLCAAVQRDSSIHALSDLEDKRLRWAVGEGEAGWEYAVRERGIEPYDAVVVKHPDIAAALGFLSSGQADVAVIDRWTAECYLAAHPGAPIRLLDERVWEFKNGIMIPCHDKLFGAWVRDEFSASRKVPAMIELERKMIADCRGAVRKYA